MLNELEVKNLSLKVAGQQILYDVNFSLSPQSKLALFGLNGAGKTSLLHSILGLHPAFGEILIKNGRPRTPRQAAQEIFYLPERFRPHTSLKGQEYVQIISGLRGFSSSQESSSFFTKKFATYSKGMTQQIGLYLASQTTCPILLLDEPNSGLDLVHKNELKKSLQRINKSMIITGHDPYFLQSICNEILILHEGHQLFFGPIPKDEHLEDWTLNIIKRGLYHLAVLQEGGTNACRSPT